MRMRPVYHILVTFLATCSSTVKTQDVPTPSNGVTRASNDIATGAPPRDERIFDDGDFRESRLWKSTSKDKSEWSEWGVSKEKQSTGRGQDDIETHTLQWDEKDMHVGRRRCSRYCIKKMTTLDKVDEKVPKINLFLSFTDIITAIDNRSMEDRTGQKGRLELAEYEREVGQNCVVDLNVNCGEYDKEISDQGTHVQNLGNNCNYNVVNTAETLVDSTNSSGYTEISFNVDDWMSKIHAFIHGNLSQAVLEVPGRDEMILGTEFRISLSGTNESRCLVVESSNPSPGRWCLKLIGREDLSYRFVVMASIIDDEEIQGNKETPNTDLLQAESIIAETTVGSIGKFPSLEREQEELSTLDNIETLDLHLNQESYQPPRDTDDIDDKATEIKFEKLVQDSNVDPVENVRTASEFKLRDDVESPITTLEDKESKTGNKRLPIEEIDVGNFSTSTVELRNRAELAELEDFDRIVNEESPVRKKKISVDVSPQSKLIISPDTTSNQNVHRIYFDVRNNYAQTVRCEIRASSSPFRVFNVYPIEVWLVPGQTASVAVDVEVPRGVVQENINTITLFVKRSEIVEKSAYLYIQTPNSKAITDDTKPTIEYKFNSNCNGKLKKDECAKHQWSADIKITDAESGLKYVSATPNNLYEQADFISGTKNQVKFYYSANCCTVTAKITAVDLLNNENTMTIDVTVWDNLSEAEVAVIVVGVLSIILFIVLIILIIIYCVRRKKSLDLPYTQRYGSRQPGRTEGTNF